MLFEFSASHKKVLVIDDDASLQRQIRFHLEHKHDKINVVQALDGQAGLDHAFSHKPDLIILDWVLPDIQGPEILVQLKQHKKTKNTPVLMLSGNHNIGDIEDMFSLKAECYITKPFTLQNLGEKVVELLS